MQTENTVVLVTGANKGIGYEVARHLASEGKKVLLGARDETRGKEAAAKLQADGLDVEFVQLDVTDPATYETASQYIEENFGKLDVLINNAGVYIDGEANTTNVSLDVIRKTFETNFFGVIGLTQALLPLVRKSDAGRIVNVSSGLGSLTGHSDPYWEFYQVKPFAYNSSKTALNAFTVMLAYELKDTPIKVNSADPGYTATDLNGNSGYQTIEQGSAEIIRLANLPADGPTGSFFNDKGEEPW